MDLPVSPLAPKRFPTIKPVPGVYLATGRTGMKYKDRDDLLLAIFEAGTVAAGVFTTSKCPGAPVDWDKENLARDRTARALVVNAGNANAFTGVAGEMACEAVAKAAASLVDHDARHVYLASTGVIGEILPTQAIVDRLSDMAAAVDPGAWAAAAGAIRTTDTFAKGATATAKIGGTVVTVSGIAKGSGMIQPDMATMLAFVMTDARVPANILDVLLRRSVDTSFHCVTVDGDTSTSDTVLAFATGQADHPPITDVLSKDAAAFARALDKVCTSLAQQIARDGEGATKLMTITVTGAESDASARKIGLTVANSPLVKTAIAGEDANWGRIVMAVGKAGQPAVRDRLAIAIGGVRITEGGMVRPDYDEAEVVLHMQGDDIRIAIDVGTGGPGKATVWTCDLTHGYISINGDYRS